MNDETFVQAVEIDGARISLVAAKQASGEPYWHLFINSGSTQTTIAGFSGEQSLQNLKDLKKLLNDGIKHLNDKQGKNNDDTNK